jgi:SDR family mycofactocin-dependent oxidoreductase
MGRLDGKVALITGAARGQGRNHALRLAEEGADIIAVDACTDVASVPYPMATADDLAETVKLVENLDRRIVAHRADVRDYDALKAAVDEGVAQLGHLDVVLANAGVLSMAPTLEMPDEQWDEMIDINLGGVWRTLKAVCPVLIEQGTGGSIVITSSVFGLKGAPAIAHYVAAKHGVVGLMRCLVNEISPYNVRVNCVLPTTVDTDMIQNPAAYNYFGVSTREDFAAAFQTLNALPVPWVEKGDISEAVLYLASDESRYVTGQTLGIDAGFLAKVG